MNILFVIGTPLIVGGHVLSTMSLIKEIEKKGHQTFLIGGEGVFADVFRQQGSKVFTLRNTEKTIKYQVHCFEKSVAVIKKYRIDIVQAQDQRVLSPVYFASALTGKTMLFTKAGGEIPRYIIPEDLSVIVFSKELMYGMKKNGYKNALFFIPERIDCETYREHPVDSLFMEKYHLPANDLKLVMAMRFGSQKKKWLMGILDSIETNAAKNIHFVLAGDGPLFDQISAKADKINMSFSKKTIHLIRRINQRHDIIKLYNYADIVAGHGRGILEAMACGKPVINIGENKSGTIVDDENVERIAYYNFSGRHLRFHPDMGKQPVDEIIRIANDVELRKSLSDFSKKYIKRYYDAKKGANVLLRVYGDLLKNKKRISPQNVMQFVFERSAFAIQNRIKAWIHG